MLKVPKPPGGWVDWAPPVGGLGMVFKRPDITKHNNFNLHKIFISNNNQQK